MMRIMAGVYDTALVIGLCKGSENPPNDQCTLMFSDPFYQRTLGLNETIAAAMQMHLYMKLCGVSLEQCAKVAVKNLSNGLRNPYAHRKGRTAEGCPGVRAGCRFSYQSAGGSEIGGDGGYAPRFGKEG